MADEFTLWTLLSSSRDDRTAIAAPATPPLTYGSLRRLIASIVASLNAAGIGRNDRVAIVLPNGPGMACAFLGVAAGATAAPLNPAYTEDEFSFYLSDLGTKALIVESGSESPVIASAKKLGIPVIAFETLSGSGADEPIYAGPDDVALVLHTSGTTSRPKIVPLTQTNIVVSAGNIVRTLTLGPADTNLNIMPLFHIHGLMAGLLAPLSAGGTVFATPGFNALKFFAWMDEAKPTWYTAVPTMHQVILTRAARHRDTITRHPLRFIRSSSSSMPPQVIAEIEATFAAPLIESYGMTEAAHQMASNPLPPARRKPGSVGLPAGPEIAIIDEAAVPQPRGTVGEIAIRGANVTKGYDNNPKANADAFANGWFRTGDQGMIDQDGYLAITGRLKEIINRGGEKVSPREVDEVLMDHPAVAQVVTFAMPHEKLGEDVAAVVVLRDGLAANESALRDFASQHLAAFKVPRKIVFLSEIPKGASGKLQRIGLAQKLGLGSD
jgi:acyl-CoA synthetase (AMP-forming)/AMP-acid ligase II